MNLLSLRYFLVAAEELNFSRAADKLYITQQTLSAHIKKLEEFYNVQLFERKPRLKLTYAGKQLAKRGRILCDMEKQISESLIDLDKDLQGQIRIGITPTLSKAYASALLQIFSEKYPSVSFILIEDKSLNLPRLLLNDTIDLYIGGNTYPVPNTEEFQLFEEKYCCIINKDLLMKYCPSTAETLWKNAEKGLDLLAVKELPFVMLPQQNSLRLELESYFAANGYIPKVVVETSQIEVFIDACRKGLGIGVLADYSFFSRIFREDTRTAGFPITNNLKPYSVNLVHKKYTHPAYINDFIDMTRSYFSTCRYLDRQFPI